MLLLLPECVLTVRPSGEVLEGNPLEWKPLLTDERGELNPLSPVELERLSILPWAGR